MDEEDDDMPVVVPTREAKRPASGAPAAVSVAEALANRAAKKREKKSTEGGMVFSSAAEFVRNVRADDADEDAEDYRSSMRIKREVKREGDQRQPSDSAAATAGNEEEEEDEIEEGELPSELPVKKEEGFVEADDTGESLIAPQSEQVFASL